MFARLYQNIVIEKPKLILTLLILCLLGFGYYTKDFKLDASSDTLLIENDPDLKYLREVTDRYGAKEFLVLTFTPKESIISDNSINNLLSLKKEREKYLLYQKGEIDEDLENKKKEFKLKHKMDQHQKSN